MKVLALLFCIAVADIYAANGNAGYGNAYGAPQGVTWTAWANGNFKGKANPKKVCDDGFFVKEMEWKEQSYYGLVDLKFYCNDDKRYFMTLNDDGNWNRALKCDNGFDQTTAREQLGHGIVNDEVSCVDRQDFMPSNSNTNGKMNPTQSCPHGAKITGFETQEQKGFGIINYRFQCTVLGSGASLGAGQGDLQASTLSDAADCSGCPMREIVIHMVNRCFTAKQAMTEKECLKRTIRGLDYSCKSCVCSTVRIPRDVSDAVCPEASLGTGSLARVGQVQTDCADQIWTPSKMYDFEYHGRLLTGLPSLSSQYSGIGMRASVKLYAKTSNTIVLKVENPKYVDVNHVLYPKERGAAQTYKNDGWNWRNLYLPPLKDVPAEHKQILAKPIEFVVACDGAIRKVVVSKNEPEWSINFKKALLVLFQTKVDTYNIQLEQNRIQHPSSEWVPKTWVVKEDSMQGSCENTYQVNELPEHIIKEKPELVPFPSKCASNPAERKYFEITRTRNLQSCERNAQFNFFKSGRVNAMSNGGSRSPLESSRTSVTRSIVCAKVGQQSLGASSKSGLGEALRASDIVVQKIINENEQNGLLMGFDTERFVTGAKQIMMLRNVVDAQNIPAVSQPMELFDLMYEYDIKTMTYGLKGSRLGTGAKGGSELEGNILSKIHPKGSLSALYGASSSMSPIAKNEQVKKLLQEVVNEVIQSQISGPTEEENKSNINLKLLSIARGVSIYKNAQEIKQLWSEVQRIPCTIPHTSTPQHQQVMKNFFIDAVAMAGTPASFEFIVELIEQDKMTTGQTFNFLTWMPHYAVYPTRALLQKLYNTIRSEKIQRHTTLRNMAITSFTQLLEQACVSGERKVSYPTFVTGEFCNINSRIVKDEWIPYLLGRLASASDANERNVYLVALGALKHKAIIRELIPYVSGALNTQVGQQVTTLNRLLATYSLTNIGSTNPSMVIPTLMTVFSNPSESTEIRIAAFNCLLRMNPSTAVFQRIASVTQQEPRMDLELLKTINIALYSLGKEVSRDVVEPANVELINKARATFELTRRVTGIYPTSGTIYTADFLSKLGVGYESFIAYVTSEASILPKSMYTEIKYVLNQLSVLPLRLGYRINGHENLFEGLRKELVKGLNGAGFSGNMEASSQGQEPKIDAALIVQLFQSGAFFLSGEQISIESLTQILLPYIKNTELLKQNVQPMDINMQRTFNLAQMDILIPSDMGFPIHMEHHAPMTASVVGKITPQLTASAPTLEISGKVLVTGQFVAYVGTAVPFSKGLVLTGVDHHAVVNVPGTVKLEMDIPSQKAKITVKPDSRQTTPLDVLHVHRYPFTVNQRISDLTPIPEQPQMKQIRSPAQLKRAEKEFGDYLGLKMTTKIETESAYTDLASVFDVLKAYNNNPLNLLLFPWTISPLSEKLTPSLRRQRFSVIYDRSQSSTNELGLEIRVGCATKQAGESSGKYHTLKVKASPGSLGGGSMATTSWVDIMKKLSPYGVSEKAMDASAVHPKREQKLKEMLNELEAGAQATAVTLQVNGIIKGSRPRVWQTALSFLGGVKKENSGSIKPIWDVRLEKPSGSPDSPKHLCVKGALKAPLLPIWNTQELQVRPIDFVFDNKVGMGMSSCNDASVTTSGIAKVSEQQKEFSRTSMEATKCKEIMQRGGALASGSPAAAACKTANYQARTVDTIELTNHFSKVPEVVIEWERRLTTIAKAYLWPFVRNVEQNARPVGGPNNSFTTRAIIKFQKRVPAFDLIVMRPQQAVQEKMVFREIRIPYPFSLVAPLRAMNMNF